MATMTSPSPFLALPPELHNPIYEMTVVASKPIRVLPVRNVTTGACRFVIKDLRLLTSILKTCRQVRLEARPLFLAQNTFQLEGLDANAPSKITQHIPYIIDLFFYHIGIWYGSTSAAANVTVNFDTIYGQYARSARDLVFDAFRSLQLFAKDFPTSNVQGRIVLVIDNTMIHVHDPAVQVLAVDVRKPETSLSPAIEVIKKIGESGGTTRSGESLAPEEFIVEDVDFAKDFLVALAGVLGVKKGAE